jgi:hypothetical protein
MRAEGSEEENDTGAWDPAQWGMNPGSFEVSEV